MTQPQTSEPTSTPIPEVQASFSGQSVEITHSHAVAPQEIAVDALPNHLIVIHTTPQPVHVIERTDSLRLKEIARTR